MSASRLLALFTVCFVVGTGLAALAVHAVASVGDERHHTYWCVHPSGFALPCMYRKNTPIDV